MIPKHRFRDFYSETPPEQPKQTGETEVSELFIRLPGRDPRDLAIKRLQLSLGIASILILAGICYLAYGKYSVVQQEAEYYRQRSFSLFSESQELRNTLRYEEYKNKILELKLRYAPVSERRIELIVIGSDGEVKSRESLAPFSSSSTPRSEFDSDDSHSLTDSMNGSPLSTTSSSVAPHRIYLRLLDEDKRGGE